VKRRVGASADARVDPAVGVLLDQLSPPSGRSWFGGPTLHGSLRGLDARVAARPPGPGRKSIWQVALHAAYWKSTARRRITGATAEKFPRSPSNWPSLPLNADARAWDADRELVKLEHERLLEAVRALDPRGLDVIPPGAKVYTVRQLVLGIAEHDAYHVGQIQLLKRLLGVTGR
jgi:uncharacterized damage-inducible protein DinB